MQTLAAAHCRLHQTKATTRRTVPASRCAPTSPMLTWALRWNQSLLMNAM